ncbi:MAG: hypothetical protein A2Y76_08740 [Planctomycetes bacterium RBG_13_60_9]|nr:MAG: hypothetical protein A2Y76_08740 [Planctomycetes bacterium RBG_13_60_9]
MRTKPKQRSVQTSRELPDAVQEAIRHGIDVDMLRDNLARTPAERLRRHDTALEMVEMLRKARRL